MRHSSLSLHRIAIVSATSMDASSASFPARSTLRGRGRVRGRRSFSDRPIGGGENRFVTGDSHFQSVRDANLGFRRDNYNNSNNNGNLGFRNGNFVNNRPPYSPRPQFNRNRPGSHNAVPPPPFYGDRVFRPLPPPRKPKLADYRNWEHAKCPPPPRCERFVVLSYNILADYLASSHRKLYFHIPYKFMDWEWRKRSITFELGLWSPDIMCFQEVDKFNDLQEELKLRGYSGIWKMRTGNPIDGCAIFWRTSRFKLVHEECIEFNKLGLRDNVAQICVLESLTPNETEIQSMLSASSARPNRVVVCNIHVLYNPKRGEIKLGQVRLLLNSAEAVSKIWDDAPVVICGDFNCVPKSPLYNFISEQKLDISDIDRDKVSGQASAEIHPSPSQKSPNPRVQLVADRVLHSAVAENSNANTTSADVLVDDKKQNNPKRISEDTPPADSIAITDQSVNENDKITGCFSSAGSENIEINSGSAEKGPFEKECISGKKSVSCDKDGSSSMTDHDCRNERVDETVDASTVNEYPSEKSPEESAELHSQGSSTDQCSKFIRDEAMGNLTSSDFDASLNDKLGHLSLNDLDEASEGDANLGEDPDNFLSELHNNSGGFPSDLGDDIQEDLSPRFESESSFRDKASYDPSLWTPMEITTATGSADCTLLEHPLKLTSTYTEVEDCSGARDSNGEPLATSYHRCFFGTVDYIWRSEGLHTVKVLAPISKDAMQWTPGFPTKKWGSDHIALVSELAFTNQSENADVQAQ